VVGFFNHPSQTATKDNTLDRYSVSWRSGAWKAVRVSRTMSKNECASGDDPGTDGTATDHASTGESLEIRYRDHSGVWRRIQFEPRPDGPGWDCYDEEWTGCHWRPVGRAVVTDLWWQASVDGR